MAKQKLSDSEQVSKFITDTQHPLKELMQAIRQTILEISSEISEHIKWNVPSFYYNAEMADFDAKEYKRDIVVYHTRKNDQVLLIFPTGNTINNESGILEGNYTDGRRMITIKSVEDLNTKKVKLEAVIKDWISKVEK